MGRGAPPGRIVRARRRFCPSATPARLRRRRGCLAAAFERRAFETAVYSADMLALFKTHGAVAFAILVAGILAIVTGLLSVALSKKRDGAKVGVFALGLVAITCTIAVASVMR